MTITTSMTRRFGITAVSLSTALLVTASCSEPEGKTRRPCVGAKCDVPDGEGGEMCVERRREAFNRNQRAFTETAIRWACEDTQGVNGIDRGQEYCEYFSVVKLPSDEEPQVLGRLIRIEPEPPEDGEEEEFATFEQTPINVELTADQIAELETEPDAIVGQCVFSSWNLDAPETVPACYEEDGCPQVQGLPVDAENFRMKMDFNSIDAAQVLIEDCLETELEGDLANLEDPLHDDYMRGCMANAEINETQYRKSDSNMCAAINRLAECECYPLNIEAEFPEELSPWDRRGFPLGGWAGADKLPAGCQFVELGDSSNTVVSCELTANDVLSYSDDPKALCRERYAPNVVVHVPVNPAEVICTPSNSSSAYADSCSKFPWVLSDGETGQY